MLRLNKKLNAVVLIDDEPANNFISESYIRRMNLTDHVVKFESPVKALSYFESIISNCDTKPDLVLLDINMPLMNGWEFLNRLRSIKLNNKIALVMLSSSMNKSDLQRAEEAPEVSLFLQKPLEEQGIEKILFTNFSDRIL